MLTALNLFVDVVLVGRRRRRCWLKKNKSKSIH
jgi:hypothetical protein